MQSERPLYPPSKFEVPTFDMNRPSVDSAQKLIRGDCEGTNLAAINDVVRIAGHHVERTPTV